MVEADNCIRKDTPAHVFSCEFCKIFKNTFSTEDFRMSISVHYQFRFIDSSPQMSKVGKSCGRELMLRSNAKTFEGHKNCKCYKSEKI